MTVTRTPRSPFLPVLFRFLAGMHLDGKRRSDATFWADGTQGVSHWFAGPDGSWWARRAGWKRALIRWAAVAFMVGWWRWRHATEWVLVLIGGPGAGIGVYRAVNGVRMWQHRRHVERPIAAALAPYLGTAPRQVAAGLEIVSHYEDSAGGERIAALTLPDDWDATPDRRTRVAGLFHDRLGVDVTPRWRTNVYPMVAEFTRSPTPPEMVRFADIRTLLDSCPRDKILLGMDPSRKVRYGDLALEDPHWIANAGSRRGKTSLILLYVAQLLRQATTQEIPAGSPPCSQERVTGIDPKQISLDALVGVPGVTIYSDPRDIEGMWEGIKNFRKFTEERFVALKEDKTVQFRRSALVIDEINQFAAMTAMHWRATKQKGDPPIAPVWNDLALVAWMGAQAKCNILAVGQDLKQDSIGGLRNSFGVRLLAGFTPQQYMFLVGLRPVLKSQKPRGRFLWFEGGELTWLQLVFGTPEEWRDYAMQGRRHGGPAGRSQTQHPADLGSMAQEAVSLSAPTGAPGVHLVGAVSLREAVDTGILSCTLDTARWARANDPRFPRDRGKDGQTFVYDPEELTTWDENRPRSGNRAEAMG